MDEALCSILCEQTEWTHEMGWSFCIKFNRDGTGELCAIGDLGVFIFAVNTKWKCIPRPQESDATVNIAAKPTNIMARKPRLLGQLHLEITMEDSLPNRFVKHFYPELNDRSLTEAAFQPRSFTVAVEKGNFMFEREVGRSNGYVRYGLRLTFDISPYPTKDGYKLDTYKGLSLREFETWLNETRTFYARSLPKASTETRATNDDSIMGYRTNGCVMS